MTDELTESDRIREDIERTRGELGEDVDALAEKVRPSSIAQRQMGKVRTAMHDVKERVMGVADDASDTVASAGEAIGRTPQVVREKTQGHPLAVGLIAFGIGVIASSLIPASRREQELATTLKEKAEPITDELADTARQAAENLKEPAREAVDAVKMTATDAVDDVKSESGMAVDDVRGSATESAQRIQDTSRG
jgi:ElaB/YqjD/DUF883 family membrane-anchored ribosome-binding protein